MKCGWPAIVTILTRDQYGEVVHAPGLKIEVKAVPIEKKDISDGDQGRKIRRISQSDPMTFGGHPPPPLDIPYEVTVNNKMCFYAITIMHPYQNYSFEELRFMSPIVKRSSESMLVRPNGDGSYSATWTPSSVGWYSLMITIDGYSIENNYKVEITELPQGMHSSMSNILKKPQHHQNRHRRFIGKDSAGLRIRSHPSLQSEEIGIVPNNGTITFIEEVHNDDGVWLRLNSETIKNYCSTNPSEAWCLGFNQHLGKKLLIPLDDTKPIESGSKEIPLRRRIEGNDEKKKPTTAFGDWGWTAVKGERTMVVTKTGASCHNIRSRPSLKAATVGMLALGDIVTIEEYWVNSDGTWVRISDESAAEYCYSDGEAWSLAIDKNGVTRMKVNHDVEIEPPEKRTPYAVENIKSPGKAFEFSTPSGSREGFVFTTPNFSAGIGSGTSDQYESTNPFVFKSFNQGSPRSERIVSEKSEVSPKYTRTHLKESVKENEKEGGSKFSVLQKWLKGDDKNDRKTVGRDFTEFVGVSVKELVKAIGESRANGNGVTPPETPRRLSRSSSPKNPQGGSPRFHSRSSSPVPIPAGPSRQPIGSGNCLFPPVANVPVSGAMMDSGTSHRRGSTQSDTSALVSSLTRDPSQSPSGISSTANTRDISPSPSCSSLQMRSEGSITSPPETPRRDREELLDTPKKLSAVQTQTSPESMTTAMKGHFSIGSSGTKDDRQSPKVTRRNHTKAVKIRTKRAISPANTQTLSPSRTSNLSKEKVKEAISPSVAECLRAVFAAFLWHEGIVHDAMACASFLKFHPNLPKNGALVVTRQPMVHSNDKQKEEMTREQRARQRHSVEVTNAGNYLHIQPSTLEALTRSAAGANANRNRKKQDSSIKEEINGKLMSLPETHTVAILPPALKSLVFLWEEVSSNCLQAIEQQTILPSPISHFHLLKTPKKSNFEKEVEEINDSIDVKDKDEKTSDKENDKRVHRRKKEFNRLVSKLTSTETTKELETMCELCGQMFPHPIIYHMKMIHPGCGWHSGGMGYNNVGNYCSGWAGNCGDSDFGGTCWYLMCDACRDNYLKTLRFKSSNRKIVGSVSRRRGVKPLLSPINSPNGNDSHITIKNNAMFLLDLSSAAGVSIPKQQRRPSQTLSSVAENNSPPETIGPFPPTGPFQCLQALGVHYSQSHEERYYEETLRRQNGQQSYFNGNKFNATNGRPLSECHMSDSDGDGGKIRGVSTFHRSVSMSTAPWAKNSNDGRVVMMRKRNNSSSEMNSEAGSSLLCYPSAALQKLVPSMDQSAIVSSNQDELCSNDRIEILTRPVMLFVLQQHNLQHLQLAMRQALRRAACRVYAMQAFNWLLRSVTQPLGLHDLLWWFMAFLTPVTVETVAGDEDIRDRKEDLDMSGLYEHPLSDLTIAGEAINPLPSAFHTLLQTIADLMLLPPPGSPLQQAAVQCWGIKFTSADHMFLHRSHVFSNISKILSRSEEEEDVTMSMHESHQSTYSQQITTSIEALKDLTPGIEIKASSRQAMIGHLTDSSTETFWESGDEDRNKTKTIVIVCGARSFPRMIYVHIDNCRDLTHKVSSVTFQSGVNVDEMVKLRTVEIENRSAGWVNCPVIDSRHIIIGLEFKGPDNSLRVRQIRILGEIEGESLKIGKQLSTATIQKKNCEAETLKVFRLITSQVFGKLIQGEKAQQQLQRESAETSNNELEDSNDLREHMVGILFSRSKLSHLQKQVCAHIVQAIRKETIRLREEWEASLLSPTPANSVLSDSSDLPKASDTYCFEMLSMVLALSGSSVGRNYLSSQYGLIKDILSLLHTGSARVQRQVTSLLRRILPEIKPENLANVLGLEKLPPSDFSIVATANGYSQLSSFNENAIGILDVFLSCIAKTLVVQVKIKGKESNGKALQTVSLGVSIDPKNFAGSRWCLKGHMNKKLAEVIIQLLKDMGSGKLSETWAAVTKAAIAENILNLTRLDEKRREPTECLKTSTLWLALASLCVLDSDHVERLSSGQWNTMDGQPPPPRPTCSNHDDDETTAIIQCNVCGNLCADCDRVLHLHRRTRVHVRQVCKEEEEAIRVDLHEGCGRTKLFWVLLLADSQTLKALVEFRDGATRKPTVGTSGVCRFCGTTDNTGLLAIGNVCSDHDCQEHAKNACSKIHNCGHICGGVRSEKTCLPCLHRCAPGNDLKQDADDMCMICFTEALSCAPAIQLQCGHVFHLHCCRNVLSKRWVGPRITFGFSLCPICKVPMEHSTLEEHLMSIQDLYADVKRKALMRLEYEGLHKAEAVITPGGRYYKDPAAYAMDRYAYYVCYKCQKAYYGGEARCDVQLGGESFDPTELVCGACSDVARAQMCPKHGTDFLEYKCRYCCSTAVFFCFGTTHFCNPCHDDFQRVTNIPKNELPSCPAGPRAKQLEGEECPLHVKHPPTGEEFALGCGICRNAHTF
ncbi:E3 ubiquitin-protein ligase MYCBP2-like isoform X2 [Chelonus insularis]|uniref:E3 ubiquitin-protein ligase MYCBP2-like isoform X2 n=1 Tax=Chelonus insularis TaxID=460826 RepID=UPI0015899988|nr:E3 ubiquitin-protein ligase MYCBP2-like isoform X2 [Chelonus insularis]